VTAVHITETDRAFDDLTIATPIGSATITSTAYRLFWDVTAQKWTQADEPERRFPPHTLSCRG
jgi:hypothetical protein